MSRYINADKLEKDGWSMQRIRQASPTEMIYETKKPTDFSAADVVEVRHGRWETAMLDHEAFGVRPKVLYCSECNQCIAYPTRYCPNCGAKMGGGDK